MEKSTVKINYHGFWPGFDTHDNLLINALEKNFNVEISDKPDFVFCSWFDKSQCRFNDCIKIFYSHENHSLNMFVHGYNYAIGLRWLSVDNSGKGRYLRHCVCPEISVEHRKNLSDNLAKRKFCNFIYSNQSRGNNVQNRIIFCQQLQKYKWVDCPGTVLHNTQPISQQNSTNPEDWVAEKLNYIKNYKFTIAFENSIANGYATEKIWYPFMADSIPVYMGSPSIADDFNPKAFINVADYKNFDEVIEKILELDNNDELYMQMLREPVYLKEPEYDKRLEKFLYDIVTRGNTTSARFIKPFFNT